jgi:putative oxidoreductase
MKIAYTVIRVLVGLLFIFSSMAFLLKLVTPPEQTGDMKIFMDGMIASGYLLYAIKITELLCGLAFVSGFFVPLASVVISPIIVNIFLVHVFLDTSGLPVGIILILSNLFFAYFHKSLFLPILKPKIE